MTAWCHFDNPHWGPGDLCLWEILPLLPLHLVMSSWLMYRAILKPRTFELQTSPGRGKETQEETETSDCCVWHLALSLGSVGRRIPAHFIIPPPGPEELKRIAGFLFGLGGVKSGRQASQMLGM